MKTYTPEVISLATYVAEKLNDVASINAYLRICEKYKEEHVRRVLDKVLSIPMSQIRKTPGALFTFLVSQHEPRIYSRD
jgi:hypothetical protein